MNTTQQLFEAGQSIWYDNIQRKLLDNGELAGMIERGEIRGVTSNPSIFMNAIAKSHDYDDSLVALAAENCTTEEIFWRLAIEDIQAAADLFRPLYDQSSGGDGYVSLEVSPYLAHDTAGTLSEAKRLWGLVNRPNLMIKIPATLAGLPAITEAIAAGLNVNVTLIFSRQRYAAVMDAYLAGLEKRAAQGLPVEKIASVASFFVSRVDTMVDAKLQTIATGNGPDARLAGSLLGKAAIANARLAYHDYEKVFDTERFKKLQAKGAHPQRPLWASTSSKNPNYRDVIYVEELVGPGTVNTVPPQTLVAFLDHGIVRPISLQEGLGEAQQALDGLELLGISYDDVTRRLEEDGVKAFADAFTELLAAVETRKQNYLNG